MEKDAMNLQLKMPNYDSKHKAISSRITALQYLKTMTSRELIADSGIELTEFKLMEFCYDPKNNDSIKMMLDWLEKNEYLIKRYYGKSYGAEFIPLDIYYYDQEHDDDKQVESLSENKSFWIKIINNGFATMRQDALSDKDSTYDSEVKEIKIKNNDIVKGNITVDTEAYSFA